MWTNTGRVMLRIVDLCTSLADIPPILVLKEVLQRHGPRRRSYTRLIHPNMVVLGDQFPCLMTLL